VEDHARWSVHSHEFDKRFEAATGVTTDQWRDVKYGDPRKKELEAIWDKVSDELHREGGRRRGGLIT
jgi:hypothetical protein